MNWKNYIKSVSQYSLSSQASATAFEWGKIGLRLQATEENKTVYSVEHNGFIEEEQYEDFLRCIERLGTKMQMVENNNSLGYKTMIDNAGRFDSYREFIIVFFGTESIACVTFHRSEASVTAEGFSEREVNSIVEPFCSLLKKNKERKGRVCTALMDNRVYISDLGQAGIPLVRENYSEEVLKNFDFLVKDFSSSSPTGRLAIIDGPPGTGKSYFVRALIEEITNCVFVIIPSALVSRISDPSFMPAILNLSEDEQAPIVLIIEDADAVLLPRGMDNMAVISDLLNFADGIVGKIVDLRIIATTNAKKIEIEPALLRRGRISKHVHIGFLEPEHAYKIFQRITGVEPNESHKKEFERATLADVYYVANNFLAERA